METSVKIECPKCGSENVIVQKRGYSFLQGFSIGIILVLADWFYTVYVNSAAYSAMDEAGQVGFVMGLLLKAIPLFILGLLLGLIGKNKLVARCLKCKYKFDPSRGIKD